MPALPPPPIENPDWNLALAYVESTNTSLFLTGRAGTGKTTFLHHLRATSPKRMVVTAPTGVAAIQAGGVTLHSFFQLPIGPQDPACADNPRYTHFSREKSAILRSIDLLVIDEISMVRADLLDAVDRVLRRFQNPAAPFGGLQLLMIGDLRQLPPIARNNEWSCLQSHYHTPYFFGSHALHATPYRCIELRHVYRQRDSRFLDLLNQIRTGHPSPAALSLLNQRVRPSFTPPPATPYITLCTHNAQAQQINQARLDALPSPPLPLNATLTGTFPPASFPTEASLRLKVGAQVMFIKNDPAKRFFNGRIGFIDRLAPPSTVLVRCPDDPNPIRLSPMTWENIRYTANPQTGRISETIEGTFRQYPLKLAWAITIHKSQGLTFDHAIIQANRAFAPGQVYVALSRCRSLDGLVLPTPIPPAAIQTDPAINRYLSSIESRRASPSTLPQDRLAFRSSLLDRLFDFHRLATAAHRLRRLADTNPTALPPPLPLALSSIADSACLEIQPIGDRFRPALQALLQHETNPNALSPPLLQRLRAAARYFLPRLHHNILSPAENADTDIDNQTVRRTLRHSLATLADEARVKIAAFDACQHDPFTPSALLHAAAQALLQTARPKKSQPPAPENPQQNPNPTLLPILRAWRRKKAADSRLPPYLIFSQKSLYALARLLPLTPDDLSRVHGFGRAKTDRYGPEILPLIRDYCRETHAKPLPSPPPTLF